MWDHGHDPQIGRRALGRVHDIAVHSDGILRGVAHFAENKFATEIFNDVEAGVLRDVSVGAEYAIDDMEFIEDDILVKRWTILEASIVSIPADSSVGVNRDQATAAPAQVESSETLIRGSEMPTPVEPSARDAAQIKTEGATEERNRVESITNQCEPNLNIRGVSSLMRDAIKDGRSAEMVMSQLNDILRDALAAKHGDVFAVPAEEIQPVHRSAPESQSPNTPDPKIEVQVDQRDKFREAMTENIIVRSGHATKEERESFMASEYRSFDLIAFCRQSNIERGISMAGLDEAGIVSAALQRDGGATGTSDLGSVVADVANKQMLAGYSLDEGVWRQVAKIGSLSDFRPTSRINLSTVGNLEEIAEDAGYKRGHLQDYNETLTAKTYGRELMFSRRLIINDNVGALVEIPRKFGQKANQRVSTFVTSLIVANPQLEDGVEVFHANHGNIGTTGAITVSSLSNARKLMRLQKEKESKSGADDGEFMNLRGELLLVPPSLEGVAQQVIGSEFDPATSNDTRTQNPFFGQLSVLVEPRLEAASATRWYMFASPSAAPTLEVAFLNGQDAPFIDQINDWDTDGIKMKARIEFDAAFLDFPGVVMNAGA